MVLLLGLLLFLSFTGIYPSCLNIALGAVNDPIEWALLKPLKEQDPSLESSTILDPLLIVPKVSSLANNSEFFLSSFTFSSTSLVFCDITLEYSSFISIKSFLIF